MNIFVTSACPIESARNLDDKRVVKMVLETAQMLSTAARYHGYTGTDLYKPTHANHPCNVWARTTSANYTWLWEHMYALAVEYRKRYGRMHKSATLLGLLYHCRHLIPEGAQTPFANCAANAEKGVNYKHVANVYTAYKLYLADRWTTDARTPTWYKRAA